MPDSFEAMEGLDRFLSKYAEEGYDFSYKDRPWGRSVVGTRARGGQGKTSLTGFLGSALGLTNRMLVAAFESNPPSEDDLEAFLKEAARFKKENAAGYEITAVVVLTREKLEKRAMNALLKDVAPEVQNLLQYRTFPTVRDTDSRTETPSSTAERPQKGSGPSASTPSEPSVTPIKIDYEAVTRGMPALTLHERVLYAWEVLPEPSGPSSSPAYLVVTQERCVLMHKAGSDYVQDGWFRWEQAGEPATDIDAGGPVLRIYDGVRDHRLRNKDAQFIQVLIHHLKYARDGWISAHMIELGFDPELVSRCQPDFVAERYSLAVRNAFALLETRVRLDSMAPRDKIGVDLATYAFHQDQGRIPVGVSQAEREGVYMLFRGAFMAFRDPAAHNDQLAGVDRGAAFHQLALVDLLLKLTHKGKEQFQRGAQ